MNYEKINEIMLEIGLPYAYHHFAEGESPEPPFMLFYSVGENNFSADNSVFFSSKKLNFELYTDRKNPDLEGEIEAVFRHFHIFYTKSEAWISSEKMYEILYQTEV